MTKKYNTQDNQKVPVTLNWLGREGLQFMQTLNDEEHEKCKANMGVFEVLREIFKVEHSETVLPLQYWKVINAK